MLAPMSIATTPLARRGRVAIGESNRLDGDETNGPGMSALRKWALFWL
jgi:hypothetical protein